MQALTKLPRVSATPTPRHCELFCETVSTSESRRSEELCEQRDGGLRHGLFFPEDELLVDVRGSLPQTGQCVPRPKPMGTKRNINAGSSNAQYSMREVSTTNAKKPRMQYIATTITECRNGG